MVAALSGMWLAHHPSLLACVCCPVLWIDGGLTLQAFLAAGLVDVIMVTRIPILIGRGMPLFGSLPDDVRLEHLGTQSFQSGVVQSSYAVKK